MVMVKRVLSRERRWQILQMQKKGGRQSVKEGLIDSPLGSPGILTQLYAADGLFVGFALSRSRHI